MARSEYVVIVGCGRLGAMLANRLSATGNQIVVVDVREGAFDKLSTEFSGYKVVGNAIEMRVLRDAQIDEADYVFAVTRIDNVNLMVAQIARRVFKVPRVVARVFDPARESIYREFGIETISPVKLTAEVFLDIFQNTEGES